VDLLIAAYRQLAADCEDLAPLVIAGPGLDTEFGKQCVRLAGDDPRICFTGMLGGELKWGAVSGAECMVLPSHQENFGLVVVEALACGTPVLLTRQVDIWREVCEAGAGWVEADTVEGVFTLLQRWQSASREHKQAMRLRAKLCFSQHYSAARAAEASGQLMRDC
jgi:glycosyltransferase involved in cell wall biosynthesis